MGFARHLNERRGRVLVGVFGVDRLARSEAERATQHLHLLCALADEVHLDASEPLVEPHGMTELVQWEVALQFAVDTGQ